jgi:small subunit ribosomal protein S17
MTRTKETGFGIKAPSKSCEDKNCPFHGTLKVRGKQFTGTVVSQKMQRSVVVEWVGWRFIPKYERYKKTKTKVTAHNPPCVHAVEGDVVKIGECRPLSKTKNFVVLKVLGKEEKYALEKEALEEGKHKEAQKELANKAELEQKRKSAAASEENAAMAGEEAPGPAEEDA